jgi:hypothetical protein
VVFLVDHDAVKFTITDSDGPGALSAAEFAADELTLHEELGIERRKCFHVDMVQRTAAEGLAERFEDAVDQFVSDVGRGTCDEWESSDVASESNATGNYNVGLRAVSAEPFTACGSKPINPDLVLLRTG